MAENGMEVPSRKESNCVRCRNHGLKILLRGHKQYCPYASCACDKCRFTAGTISILYEFRVHSLCLNFKTNNQNNNDRCDYKMPYDGRKLQKGEIMVKEDLVIQHLLWFKLLNKRSSNNNKLNKSLSLFKIMHKSMERPVGLLKCFDTVLLLTSI